METDLFTFSVTKFSEIHLKFPHFSQEQAFYLMHWQFAQEAYMNFMLCPHFWDYEIVEDVLSSSKPFTNDNISQTCFIYEICISAFFFSHMQQSDNVEPSTEFFTAPITFVPCFLQGKASTERICLHSLVIQSRHSWPWKVFFFFHSFLLFSLLLFFFPLLIIHVLIWSSQAVEKWQGSVIRPWALHWCTAMLEGLEWKRPYWLECKAHS